MDDNTPTNRAQMSTAGSVNRSIWGSVVETIIEFFKCMQSFAISLLERLIPRSTTCEYIRADTAAIETVIGVVSECMSCRSSRSEIKNCSPKLTRRSPGRSFRDLCMSSWDISLSPCKIGDVESWKLLVSNCNCLGWRRAESSMASCLLETWAWHESVLLKPQQMFLHMYLCLPSNQTSYQPVKSKLT